MGACARSPWDAFPNCPSTRHAGRAPPSSAGCRAARPWRRRVRRRRRCSATSPLATASGAVPAQDLRHLLEEPADAALRQVRLDAIDHAQVSAWFDAGSVERPGAANRTFEILRAMLRTARQCGEIGEHVPDACANIVKNPRRPVARCLDRKELEHLGAVLDRRREEHPWPVAVIRLLTLTGARLSEVLNLRWEEIGEFTDEGTSARLKDTKTGLRTLWLGPEAVQLLAALPQSEGRKRVFSKDLTSNRLYTFWVGIREEAGLPGLRIHDCRHTWASQGVMNGVGRLLGHRQRETTAIYGHLDDGALRDAAAQAAAVVIARAMGYSAEPPPMPNEVGTTIYWPTCLSFQALKRRPYLRENEFPSGSCPESPIGPMARRRKTARANPARDRPSTGCD